MIRLVVRRNVRELLSPGALRELRRRAGRMAKAAALADPSLGPPDAIEVGLTLTDDAEIQALNREFRGKDRPTDVLAFAMREGKGGELAAGLWGDVVISIPTARRQARERRHTTADEVEFLWAHGLCHLLGYDHRNDREERAMNAKMASLIAEGRRRGRVRAA